MWRYRRTVTFMRGLVARAVVKFSGCSFQELNAMPAAVLQKQNPFANDEIR
jgi:hypothetical protein